MNAKPDIVQQVPRHLHWPLRLTRLGMLCERGLRAFWPFVSVIFVSVAVLMFGLHDVLPLEAVWALSVIALLGALAAAVWGVVQMRLPSRAEALARLDATLPGRPIAALLDDQAIGADDPASRAVWQAHLARMAERAATARAARPDLRIAARDPFALRYVALVALIVALLFGSALRMGSIVQMAPGGGATQGLATGPVWEGWVEPPAYTGRPTLYLNDQPPGVLNVPQGSTITLRLYGEVGALSVDETVSGRVGELPPATDPSQSFAVTRPGRLAIEGPGGAEWDVVILPDAPPQIAPDGPVERAASGEMRQPFSVSDDYGVVAGRGVITLDLAQVPRRYGYVTDPEPRPDIVLDLPMRIAGDRSAFSEILIEDLSQHPWVGLPVILTLVAEDAAGQMGQTDPMQTELPGRRFFDPLAAAVIEERRELLWNLTNGRRVAQVLRAVSHRPDEVFSDTSIYLNLRVALTRLETALDAATLDAPLRDEVAGMLWDIATAIEDGALGDARERLRQAQERLAEAIRRGASDDEIAELMDELRDATDNYMRQLAEQAQDGDREQADAGETQTITQDQLEQLFDRLQELMEQGRTAEAQELLDQLAQMMENMQVAQGEPGQGEQSAGQQAMDGLGETLRQQQGLNDDTFGDLQQQFGQQGQPGQPGQPGQQGQPGQSGQGQGQPGDGPQGQGQTPTPPGEGEPGSPGGDDPGQSLADRQQALRDELERQQGNLPGAGSAEGEATRDALERAGRAMERAGDALRDEDFAGALDSQSEAMEALREGMRNLGEQLAQNRTDEPSGQGEAMGADGPTERLDPLGRNAGNTGRAGTPDALLQGEDVYRRARELLDEIRRRTGDQQRPDEELDYLRRLLERF